MIRTRRSAWTLPDRRRRGDRAGDAAVRRPSWSPSSCCPSTTSRRSPSSSICPRARAWRTPSASLFAAAEVARELPELRSIQAYAGTAAPFNFNGLVRHYYCAAGAGARRAAAQSGAARRAHPQQPCHRARPARAAEGASSCRRARSSRSSRCRRARRCSRRCWPRSTAPIRRPAAPSWREVKKIFASVPFIVDIDDSIGEPRPRLRISIDQDRLEFFGVEQRDVYDTVQMLLGGIPVGYSHRGEDRNPIEIAVRLPKRELAWSRALAATPVPANTLPGSQDRGRARRGRARHQGGGLAHHLPPRRPLRRHGDGGARRRLRGADLRHARGGEPHRGARLGQPAEARHQLPRPAGRRVASPPCSGTANGRSPMSPSATWAPHSRWRSSASTCWWWRSSAASACRW